MRRAIFASGFALGTLFFTLALTPIPSTAAEATQSAPTGEIIVRVIDSNGVPQASSAVSYSVLDNINRLFGSMSPVLMADGSGIVRLKQLSAENDFYLIHAMTKDGLVGYRTSLLDGKGAREKVDITVLPPQAATIDVQDESGKPIAGATIWSLTHRGTNVEVRLKGIDLEQVLRFPVARSNEAGELTLPELPEGKIDVKLFHSDYVPVLLKDFAIKKGARRDAVMDRGVKVSLHIEAGPNGKPHKGFLVRLDEFKYHDPFTLDGPLPEPGPDGTIQLTVAAGKYSSLRLTHPDFIVTPQYYA
ncbi:MAG TPA: carboxypeptidase-like regulatory domain-containing protein, partial [Pirellulales bacterium]|nr:carboxypeptidase-like regulatory domain-containing protein [Pirellulales bacterium]